MLYFKSVYIQLLWVDENYRGHDLGTRLLEKANDLGKENGCTVLHLDTFSFQAPEFYTKLGMDLIGTIDEYEEGIRRFFFKKKIK